MSRRPVLALSLGDPRGIGPEVAAGALAMGDLPGTVVVCGSAEVLARAARQMRAEIRPRAVAPEREAVLAVEPPEVALVEPVPGPEVGWREWAWQTVGAVRAAAGLVAGGVADAIVTGPLCKEDLWQAGFAFSGHTEFLQHLAGAGEVGMLYFSPRLIVELATRHVPLRRVPELLTVPLLVRQIELTAASLPLLGRPAPRIAVCGFNPHAGEGGRLGDEEQRIIQPAVREACRRGLDIDGPRPADTVFWEALNGAYDAVVALYHDQGSIPLKTVAFHEGVNVTLGLPWIRTSVDHGTAFHLAGTGLADPQSCWAALQLAGQMVERRG